MFAAHYKNCFLQILLAADDECDAAFSAVVKISEAKDLNPIATVCLREPIRSKQDAIQRGFEIGMQCVDKTLPLLSSPVLAAEKTITRSRQIATELRLLLARSAATVKRGQHLIYRSRKASAALNRDFPHLRPRRLSRRKTFPATIKSLQVVSRRSATR